jgi:hypothetical protein
VDIKLRPIHSSSKKELLCLLRKHVRIARNHTRVKLVTMLMEGFVVPNAGTNGLKKIRKHTINIVKKKDYL